MKFYFLGPFIFHCARGNPFLIGSPLSAALVLSVTQTHLYRNDESDRISSETIPVIDIAGFLDGSEKMAVAAKIGQACQEIGFFMIRGHGESI